MLKVERSPCLSVELCILSCSCSLLLCVSWGKVRCAWLLLCCRGEEKCRKWFHVNQIKKIRSDLFFRSDFYLGAFGGKTKCLCVYGFHCCLCMAFFVVFFKTTSNFNVWSMNFIINDKIIMRVSCTCLVLEWSLFYYKQSPFYRKLFFLIRRLKNKPKTQPKHFKIAIKEIFPFLKVCLHFIYFFLTLNVFLHFVLPLTSVAQVTEKECGVQEVLQCSGVQTLLRLTLLISLSQGKKSKELWIHLLSNHHCWLRSASPYCFLNNWVTESNT